MKNTRIFRLCLAVALCVGLSPSGADAQAQAPLITAAIPDAESANLTIGGAGFRAGFPVVYLGNMELPVRWANESTVDTWLPALQPGTYRLIARWPDGSQADFYLTLGAAGPAGPAGAPGPRGDRGLPGFNAGEGGGAYFAAADTSTTTTTTFSTSYGTNALGSLTTGDRNTAFGANSVSNVTTGRYNTGVGGQVLTGVTTGSRNTAVGAVAMQRIGDSSSGNTAIGRGALRHIAGSDNIGIGVNAGSAYGAYGSGSRGGTGSRNIYIGNQDQHREQTGNDNIHINHGSRSNPTGSRNIYIGHAGEPGDSGVVRLGNGNTQTKTYLAGEVIVHGSITGVGGGPLNLTGPVNAPALNTRIDELITAIKTRVDGIDASVDGIDARVKALESADTTAP